ncbi:MAG: DUF4097 family beta strand repeat protein [Prolixibacteraceae bacterium]|nr:DUF4097 family beta strand repeat protein [Prolixibacteraceae bacterium]MBN2772902.1 DUF4097 family beta strand repeat protein [Prolixibacteraceae bacterium]
MRSIIGTGIIMLFVFTAGMLAAQTSQELVVPLSKPGEKGTLEVNIMYGSIKVVGTSVKDVVINITTEQKKVEEQSKNGLKRIPNNSFGLTAEEEDNHVTVHTDLSNKNVMLEIQVPKNFNLNLGALNDGKIVVENVNGELEVHHVNGGITLTDVSGSAVVNTTNGDVKVNFLSITPDTPMAFTTFNGDVDVTFPASLKASVKMQSNMGEIFTDFDMAMKKSSPKTDKNPEKGVYKVSIEEWMYGDINGGGPEMTFKNFQGDIIIRSK